MVDLLLALRALTSQLNTQFNDYAHRLQQTLHNAGFAVDLDLDSGSTLNKKIRNAQLAQYNFIFVVGEREEQIGAVNVRSRNNEQQGAYVCIPPPLSLNLNLSLSHTHSPLSCLSPNQMVTAHIAGEHTLQEVLAHFTALTESGALNDAFPTKPGADTPAPAEATPAEAAPQEAAPAEQ